MTTEPGKFPVIDLFAGPGGLGEGFSSFTRCGCQPFQINLSIEKDSSAHRTLQLRSFFRKFPAKEAPEAYYDFLRQVDISEESRRSTLFNKYPAEAEQIENEARLAELGEEDPERVHTWIRTALQDSSDWVLIGGPPCQAYSVIGRARNQGNSDYEPEKDKRQYLYVEYLQIIVEHQPAVFVMENVTGLLSATLKNQRVFERMYEDLQEPKEALKREGRCIQQSILQKPFRYKLYSLVKPGETSSSKLSDFVVCMEHFGVPQARHRIIILGIREDLDIVPGILKPESRVSASKVLSGLPRVRSGLSREEDSAATWSSRLQEMTECPWYMSLKDKDNGRVYEKLVAVLEKVRHPRADRGGEFVSCAPNIDYRPEWFLDPRIAGVCNHSTRMHIVDDLYRYFYAGCFAQSEHRSPMLRDFPVDLLPNHKNATRAQNGSSLFADRFRVQVKNRPATTVTSHISRDGHYYIHHDPTQCRSLTVREVARLQTFPDNYFFCGPRTSQYVQVGNAVPPLLAKKIAAIVYDVLERADVCQ